MSAEALAALIGLFMPLVISLLKRATWPTIVNLAIACGVSLVVGGASVWVQGDLDVSEPASIFTSAAAAFTAATVVYRAWFADARIFGVHLNDKLTDFGGASPYP